MTKIGEQVAFLDMEPLEVLKTCPNAYSYQPHMGWAWLQRIAIRILSWRRCHFSFKEIKRIRTVDRKNRSFIAHILQQQHFIEMFTRHKPKEILCGPEDYNNFICSDLPTFQRTTINDIYYEGRGPGLRPNVCGIEVKIIPWMKGILVMPREDNDR